MKHEPQTCSVAASHLADKLRRCQTWQEVERVFATHPEDKICAWQRLSVEEKSRLKQLKALATEAQTTESPAPNDAQVFRVGASVARAVVQGAWNLGIRLSSAKLMKTGFFWIGLLARYISRD